MEVDSGMMAHAWLTHWLIHWLAPVGMCWLVVFIAWATAYSVRHAEATHARLLDETEGREGREGREGETGREGGREGASDHGGQS